MDAETTAEAEGAGSADRRRTLLVGGALAGLIAALWVGLTALTGDTYHLAPTIVTLIPALAARLDGTRPPLAALLASGLTLTALGWLAIVALGIEPTVTFLRDQPGDVPGEVLGMALVGVVGALFLVRRAPAR